MRLFIVKLNVKIFVFVSLFLIFGLFSLQSNNIMIQIQYKVVLRLHVASRREYCIHNIFADCSTLIFYFNAAKQKKTFLSFYHLYMLHGDVEYTTSFFSWEHQNNNNKQGNDFWDLILIFHNRCCNMNALFRIQKTLIIIFERKNEMNTSFANINWKHMQRFLNTAIFLFLWNEKKIRK